MKLLVGVAAGVTGLVAAYYWYRASAIDVPAGWYSDTSDADPSMLAANYHFVVSEKDQSRVNRITGAMVVIRKSANLNKNAALWTAASVLLNAVYSLAPVF